MKPVLSSKALLNSSKRFSLTARARLIFLTHHLWIQCKISSTSGWRRRKKRIRIQTTNLTKKCGSWKGRRQHLQNVLNWPVETKCLSKAISARNLKSCKTKLSDLVRSWIMLSGSETKRSLSTSRSSKRSAKYLIRKNAKSTRRALRQNRSKPNFSWTTNVSGPSGTSSWLTLCTSERTSRLKTID